jgi:hypothetical protein
MSCGVQVITGHKIVVVADVVPEPILTFGLDNYYPKEEPLYKRCNKGCVGRRERRVKEEKDCERERRGKRHSLLFIFYFSSAA